jgi:hypothetical protein
MGWEGLNFRGVSMPYSGGKISKWETSFIKDYIVRNVDTSGGNVQAFVTLVHVTIAKESIPGGAILELMTIIWVQVRPTGAAKGAKIGAIGCGPKVFVNGCVKIKNFGGSMID